MSGTVGREVGAGDWSERGIGVALARELAGGGTNLVLTARRRERLEKLARELAAAHKIRTEVFAADSRSRNAPQQIFTFTLAKAG